MRTSKPEILSHTQAMLIEAGRPITVRNRAGTTDLKVRSLKNVYRDAYDAHLAEFSIGSEKVRINIEDLKQALRYV